MNLRIHRSATSVALLTCLAFVAAACGNPENRQVTERRGTQSNEGGDASKDSSGGSGGSANAVAFPNDKATSVIKGKVVLDGELPEKQTVPIATDPFCTKCYADSGPPVLESLDVDAETKGIKWCFVELEEAGDKWTFEAPKDPVTLDQQGCVYTPHVFGIMVGQPLNVTSSDATSHNVHYFGKNRPEWVNQSQSKGQPLPHLHFKRPEDAQFRCDVHGWMNAKMYVRSHPIYAVTNDKGEFSLPKVPPGEYTLRVTHERFAFKDRAVTQKVTVSGPETSVTVKLTKP